MANTYKKVYLHIVFAVKNREALLHSSWRGLLFAYMSGIINNRGHYSLAVNGYNDHVHILLDYSLKELIPDLVREIKKASSRYIKENELTSSHFEWQSGYGVFSVGHRDKLMIINYILKQEEHHKKRSFKKEYLSLLNKYDVEYSDKYVFEFFE